ncbi:MAG: histidine phosphatase family protein [Acholeplasmataceae bacterium]|jgi:broad specificity phosphatase PhoE|nr:histidine phosphatase family protein [Acholeplasmataceae bacterium]
MKLILIRHGEPRYDEVIARGYPNQGYDLGKLTDLGVKQAIAVSKDKRLKGATLIISSPYTRALQTAAVISRLLNIELVVENDLHEWMPDVDFSGQDVSGAYEEFIKYRGLNIPNKTVNWENYDDLQKRVRNALLPYVDKHEKIIVVCHGIVMTTLTHFDDVIEHCGVREVEFSK